MTSTRLITFIDTSHKGETKYETLTTIRNCYLSYFSGSYFYEESIRTSINHHGTLISHTLDFSDFHRVTNTIDHDHQNDYVILIEGQEGSDLVKYYRAPRNLYIIWAGTEFPDQPANNIQRWYIPSHHLNRQNSNPRQNFWSHYIGLPIDSTDSNQVKSESLAVSDTIFKDLKANGINRRPALLTELSLYAKQACQQSVKPTNTRQTHPQESSSTYQS